MTQTLVQPPQTHNAPPGYQEAWEMVASQLRMEMKQGLYETWVQPLRPVSYKEGVFRLAGVNKYTFDWVGDHLQARITGLLESIFNQPVKLHFTLIKDAQDAAEKAQPVGVIETASGMADFPVVEAALDALAAVAPDAQIGQEKAAGRKKKALPQDSVPAENGSPRKIQLQRAYGTERARVIQPERGMFLTMYFFNHWLPLLGHSALTTILAARSLCYWNPMTGELRNVIETDMTELAHRADVSVRTVKDVLNHPLIKKYFLRYKVRRVMTPNGVRTAGIVLQVRMDDPLTPEDQEQYSLAEAERWYTADFEDEGEAED